MIFAPTPIPAWKRERSIRDQIAREKQFQLNAEIKRLRATNPRKRALLLKRILASEVRTAALILKR